MVALPIWVFLRLILIRPVVGRTFDVKLFFAGDAGYTRCVSFDDASTDNAFAHILLPRLGVRGVGVRCACGIRMLRW